MTNLNGDQFIYQTGLKNKPNAQGTLFRAKPEARAPEKRYPRGYTPERYSAVAEALDTTRKNFRGTGHGQHPHGGMSFSVYHGHAETLAKGVAAIARSTIPMSDITRPNPNQPATKDNPDLHMGVWDSHRGTELAHYSKPGSTAMEHQGRIALINQRPSETTPIHEVGHHVDRNMPYVTPGEQGRAEGFADAYAQTHARTPGYKQKGVTVEPHPSSWFTPESGLHDYGSRTSFTHSYDVEHPNPLHPKQFNFMEDTRKTLGPKTFPKHHIEGQKSLLVKTATYNPHRYKETDPVVTDIRWEYNNEDARNNG